MPTQSRVVDPYIPYVQWADVVGSSGGGSAFARVGGQHNVGFGAHEYDQFLEQTPDEQRRWFTDYAASIRPNVDPFESQLTQEDNQVRPIPVDRPNPRLREARREGPRMSPIEGSP